MKLRKSVWIILALVLALTTTPVFAQLGTSDVSSFTVQNVGDGEATVTITFYSANGQAITPDELDRGKPNPFKLDVGESTEIYVPGIPAGLPSGSYSVMVSSDQAVVAIANIAGQGNMNFNGSYTGFDGEAAEQNAFLPSVVYNFYGWYSLITVQNVGTDSTDVTVTISCVNGATGTYTKTGLPAGSAVTFDTYSTRPTGFTATTKCDGAAEIVSTAAKVVAVDNMRIPAAGNTQSYSSIAAGGNTLFVPALYVNYYGWDANLNIRKLTAGTTNVTVEYNDGAPDDTCTLTDANPICSLYMPVVHPSGGAKSKFGATIIADNAIAAVVNAANGSQSQTYNAVVAGTGSNIAQAPAVYKYYYGWVSSFTCQNVGSTSTALTIAYDGYAGNSYNTGVLGAGDSIEILQFNEAFLPSGYNGGVTITGASGSEIACIANFTNQTNIDTKAGDWSMSVNAFNR